MELLLASLLTCETAERIISKISPTVSHRSELVQVVKDATEEGCFEDAKAD
jgi:hypothetical protein